MCSQTIHHLPTPQDLHGYTVSSTLQIGDPSVIANQCGITTVGDFRMADMSVGGQGAPLVPYFDGIILNRHFLNTGRIGVILNIGGISNISGIIPGQPSYQVSHWITPKKSIQVKRVCRISKIQNLIIQQRYFDVL